MSLSPASLVSLETQIPTQTQTSTQTQVQPQPQLQVGAVLESSKAKRSLPDGAKEQGNEKKAKTTEGGRKRATNWELSDTLAFLLLLLRFNFDMAQVLQSFKNDQHR